MEKRGGTLPELIRAIISFIFERRRAKHFVELPEVINRIVTNEKAVSLTFDADLTPKMESAMRSGTKKVWCDEHLLATLELLKIPATFFLSGKWMVAHESTVQRIVKNPLFELGNHGYSHAGFSALSSPSPRFSPEDKLDDEEIMKAEKMLSRYPSFRRYFRFPHMTLARPRVAFVRKLGYFVVEGNINRLDVHERRARVLSRKILRRLSPGSIVALHLHDGSHTPATGAALPELIARAKRKGYRFLKLSDLFKIGRPIS